MYERITKATLYVGDALCCFLFIPLCCKYKLLKKQASDFVLKIKRREDTEGLRQHRRHINEELRRITGLMFKSELESHTEKF